MKIRDLFAGSKQAAEEEKKEEKEEEKKEEKEEEKKEEKEEKKEEKEEKKNPFEKGKEEKKEASVKDAAAMPPTGARDPGDYGDAGKMESFEMERWWKDMYPEFEKMKATERKTSLNDPEGKVELLTGTVGQKSEDNPTPGASTKVPAIFAKRFSNKWEPRKTFYAVVKVAEDGSTEAFTANFNDVAGEDANKEVFDVFTSDQYMNDIIDTVKTDGIIEARKQMNGKVAQLEGITPGKTSEVNPLYDSHEECKDSNKPREGMRPSAKESHEKGDSKEYYSKAYGDAGYASDLVNASKKIAALESEIVNMKKREIATKMADRALHLARVAASRGIIPFDLSNIEKQAMEYIKLDETGLKALANHFDKLPIVNRRAVEAYQIPEAENMASGVVHNSLDAVHKVRIEDTKPEDVAPEGIQPSVENNAKISAEQAESIRKKAAIVPQMHSNNDGASLPDFTAKFNTIENRLKRAGKFEEYKHLLRSNRRQ